MSAEATGSVPEHGHISRLAMARLLTGDVDERTRMALREHIGSCVHCGGVFKNAEAATADFARRLPTLDSLLGNHRGVADGNTVPGQPGPDAQRSKPARTGIRPGAGFLDRLRGLFTGGYGMRPAFAGILILAVASLVWLRPGQRVGDSTADLTPKGSPRFLAFLNGKPVHGDTLACAPMDTLQLAIVAAEPFHYAVLYRDDDGPLRLYMGGEGTGNIPLGRPDGDLLPHSLVLGPGWRRETLYCIWSPRPFTRAEAEAAAAGKSGDGDPQAQIIPLANRMP